ncbi:hypothetical protein [Candidatus Fukatsuia endosymbiont of Tuberolachnus salignus]|uniref:hypothetical protein n=1 Tax=Candidatus Fukatsuia endosymbiont of Tuberolachnus salignus TaxID=3077957 RepID=UPI00313C544E
MPLVHPSPTIGLTLSQSNIRFNMTGNGGVKFELTSWDTLQDFFRRLYDMLRGTNSSPGNLQEQLNKLQTRLDNPHLEISHNPFKGVFDPFIDLKNLLPGKMQKEFSVIIDYNQTDLSAGKISVSIKYDNYLLKTIVVENAVRLNNDDIKEYIEEHFNVVTSEYNFSGNFPIENANTDLEGIRKRSEQYLEKSKEKHMSVPDQILQDHKNLRKDICQFLLRFRMDTNILIRSQSSLSRVEQIELENEIQVYLFQVEEDFSRKLDNILNVKEAIESGIPNKELIECIKEVNQIQISFFKEKLNNSIINEKDSDPIDKFVEVLSEKNRLYMCIDSTLLLEEIDKKTILSKIQNEIDSLAICIFKRNLFKFKPDKEDKEDKEEYMYSSILKLSDNLVAAFENKNLSEKTKNEMLNLAQQEILHICTIVDPSTIEEYRVLLDTLIKCRISIHKNMSLNDADKDKLKNIFNEEIKTTARKIFDEQSRISPRKDDDTIEDLVSWHIAFNEYIKSASCIIHDPRLEEGIKEILSSDIDEINAITLKFILSKVRDKLENAKAAEDYNALWKTYEKLFKYPAPIEITNKYLEIKGEILEHIFKPFQFLPIMEEKEATPKHIGWLDRYITMLGKNTIINYPNLGENIKHFIDIKKKEIVSDRWSSILNRIQNEVEKTSSIDDLNHLRKQCNDCIQFIENDSITRLIKKIEETIIGREIYLIFLKKLDKKETDQIIFKKFIKGSEYFFAQLNQDIDALLQRNSNKSKIDSAIGIQHFIDNILKTSPSADSRIRSYQESLYKLWKTLKNTIVEISGHSEEYEDNILCSMQITMKAMNQRIEEYRMEESKFSATYQQHGERYTPILT